jgi:hypothetical protein
MVFELTNDDEWLARSILGARKSLEAPDLIIAPDGNPYLYRWEIIPRNKEGNIYFHIQVASDPERPLHDHPWDNFSVILSGGYDEIWCRDPPPLRGVEVTRKFRKGNTIYRRATEAHRLVLPPDIPYTMTLFTTGPKIREWGFWYPDGWRPYTEVTRQEGNKSVHIQETADAG